jgi:DNA-binding NarL/FixJ family response regulator
MDRDSRRALPAWLLPRFGGYASAVSQVRVVIAEDNLLVRTGLAALLAGEEDLTVIAACSRYEELLAEVERLQPNVVVTDIRMPPTLTDEGVRAAVEIGRTHPSIGVVLLSQFLSPAYLLELIADGSGGRGYLLKEQVSAQGQLVAAVRAVADGGSFIDPLVVDSLVNTGSARRGSPLDRLTLRERETLTEIANGKSNSAIAATFGVSERAVEKHVSGIFMKLDLEDDRDTNRRVKAVIMFLEVERRTGFG